MKNVILGLLLASFTSATVQAGSLDQAVMDKEVIAAQTAASSSPNAAIVMLVIGAVIILAVTSSSTAAGVPPAGNASDARLKTDIIRVGTAANGLPLYHFRYIGLPQVYEGVMAQDVLAHDPGAVFPLPGGYLGVDYGRLGLEMKTVH